MKSDFLLFVSMLILSISLSSAYTYKVGGEDGWAVKASRNYNFWSSHTRFLINDTLHFHYHKESDSVLVVNKQHYDSCNIKKPIHRMESGDSYFLLNKSGHFYFISGKHINCHEGEKLNVVVLSPHHENHGPSLSPVVAPTPVHSPAQSPSWNAPAPSAAGWNAPSPSTTGWNTPAHTPTTSPGWNAPSPSSAIGWTTPAHSPSQSPSWAAPTPTTHGVIAPAPSADHGWTAPAPSPGHSGSTRLSGSVGVIIMVALVLASFSF